MKNKYVLILLLSAIFSACTKPEIAPDNEPIITPSSTNELQLIADSVYLFSREIYFWDAIRTSPYDYTSFKPRSLVLTDAAATAKAVIEKVKTANFYDESKDFSYATAYDDDAGASSAAQTINDYGFYFKAGYKDRKIKNSLYANDPDFEGFYITYVYHNSDAGKKGVQRGWKMISVNGTSMSSISNTTVNILNNMFYNETLKSADIVFEKPGGQQVSLNLSITSFVPNSVLYREKLVSSTGRSVGYLVYNFFGKYNDTKADIDEAIQYFKNAGINEVVLDLRYNRGGYTQTETYLTNNFGPSAANNQVMYKMIYNANLQAGNYTMMRTRHGYSKDYYSVPKNTYYFSTTNSISTTKLYVIVSNSSASASELFINSLRPYYNNNLILIGDNNTYGKPVGFFPIHLFKKVTFWTVSFETRNKNDGAVPYTGIGPDFRIYDGVDKNWGDQTEDCLKAALNLIDGKLATASVVVSTVPRNVTPLQIKQKEVFEHSNLLYE